MASRAMAMYIHRLIKGVDQPHIAAHGCKRLDIYAPSQWCQQGGTQLGHFARPRPPSCIGPQAVEEQGTKV